MAAKGGAFNLSTTDDFKNDDEIFRVKKPYDNSPQTIRDTILKEFFGYADADITALDAQNQLNFYIYDSIATSNR